MQIHFPESRSIAAAREHLVFSEFFAMQMMIASRRICDCSTRRGNAHCGTGELLEKFLRGLPST